MIEHLCEFDLQFSFVSFRAVGENIDNHLVAVHHQNAELLSEVAGLNAGYVSNSWPLMNGRLIPDGIDWSNGAGFALTHDPFLIHFLHRWWAWMVVAALVLLARADKRAGSRRASIAIHSAFGTQILLGIATVETGMNIVMAALHQAVGASLVAAFTWGAHAYGRKGA